MYHAYQAQTDALWPIRHWATHTAQWLRHPWSDWSTPFTPWTHAALDLPLPQLVGEPSAPRTLRELGQAHQRRLAAACELISLAQVKHSRPAYGLDLIESDAGALHIQEEVVLRRPFCDLLHFKAVDTEGRSPERPVLLIVAPMSGHFATLLRDTVRVALRDHDVYITDWLNAREVPLRDGRFGLDEYIEDLMVFLRHLGPGTHLLGICQPCVAALAATALMAEADDPAAPASLSLMAGPVDCRIQPTEVNRLATSRSMAWFEQHMITTVPVRYAGRWRRVYPGYLQLSAFIGMNPERHAESLRAFHDQVAAGADTEAESTKRFYEEYFAVADLPAEFYLETVRLVFQDYALARGQLTWRGQAVRPEAIRHTRLLTVEGERDDICSLGQTQAAHTLCTGLPDTAREHHVQEGAGHYGVFSGRRWEQSIYPRLKAHIAQAVKAPLRSA